MIAPKQLSNAEKQLIRLGLRLNPTVVIIGFAILMVTWSTLFQIPLIIYNLLLLPGFALLIAWFNYAGLACVFLDEFIPHDIPERKFAKALKALEAEAVKIQQLGFEEIDRFYVKTRFDLIELVFKHQHENIALSLLCFVGRATYISLSTELNNEVLVTTSSVKLSNFPRPSTSYLQTLGNTDHYLLLEAHKDAIEIFVDHGYSPVDMFQEPWRSRFLRLERYFIRYIMTIPFWALKMYFWVFTKPGKKYQVTIREQLARQIIQIPRLNSF
ncbi:hypothetical protein H6G89_07430 [Oscillatoria sp. FACHB-1407]|uniref:hypothetical protein n=1 Tax=Oscillatoria sp. FACHB-1407 TaxID=2692847 RepID=UPI00168A24A3|nr:hypothetical protein [Oscillatoria sp. FACHB-1407]MBD2460873.1 hypothetical protein [Oscillatoria sp. FACHB-1407]